MSAKDPVIDAITAARINMLLTKPFLGTLATRLIVKEGGDWCKTVSTDGRHFFYNRDYIAKLKPEQLVFVIGHETYHCVFAHFSRRSGRDKQLFDMAADFMTNAILIDSDVGEPVAGALYDKRYGIDMTLEDIYEDLKSRSVKIKLPLDHHLDGNGGASDTTGNEGNDGEATAYVFGDTGAPQLSQEDIDQIRDEMKNAMIQAAQVVGADKVPRGVQRYIKELTESKVNWREELQANILSALKGDYSFQSPSRRGHIFNMILPGLMPTERIDVAVAIDTSGSMTDAMIRDMLSEVQGIMSQFEDFTLHLWTFDTEVHNHQVYTPDNAAEIVEYEPKGGGGTVFEVNWDFMIENEIEPHRFLMFTDGGCWDNRWGNPTYVDTLFLIHGTTSIVAPFGKTVYYEFQSEQARKDATW